MLNFHFILYLLFLVLVCIATNLHSFKLSSSSFLSLQRSSSLLFMASSSPAEDTGAPNSDSIIIIPEEEYTGPIEDAVGAPVGPLPSVSSRINFDTSRIPPTVDLWVVGAGVLGSLAAKQYRSLYPNAKIIAETRTEASHADLLEAGITPRLRSDRSQEDDFCARNVLISLPPSSLKTAEEYQEELAASCRLYNSNQYNSAVTEKRAEEEGNLVFTSSTVVYGDSFGNTVNETFRVDSRSSRSFNMICAEQAVLTRGGSVLRLAGLYNNLRGPHSFWLKSKQVDGDEIGTLNMLHYEDAAAAAIAALHAPLREQIYLACDDEPVTRSEICQAAIDSNLFPDAAMPVFTLSGGPKAKVCDSSWTRTVLKWTPKYPSFVGYMRSLGGLSYTPKSEQTKKKSLLWIPGDDDEDEL